MSLTAAGDVVGFSGAKLSLMENALHRTEPVEVIALALAYRVNCEAWKPIAAQASGDLTVNAADDVEEISPEVSVLREFGGDGLPPLFHNDDYAARLDSDDDPLRTEIVVVEEAVRQASDKHVERSHLMNIVRLAERGRMSVHVIRGHTDAEQEVKRSFACLSFRHRQHEDVVFVERPGSHSYIEDPVACQLLLQGFEALKRTALEPAESTDLIAELVEG